MNLKIPTSHCALYVNRFGSPAIVGLTFQHVPPGGKGTSFSAGVHLTAEDARALATTLADLADEIDAENHLPPNATLVEDHHANR